MEKSKRDPLLIAGKGLTVFMQGVMVIGGVALTIAIPALFIFQDTIQAAIAAEIGESAKQFPAAAICGVMLIGLAMLVIGFFFFGKLRQIINTVSQGDPFQPANADRLAHMGWLSLAAQLLMLPAMGMAIELARFADEIEDTQVTFDGGLSPTGILLVIVLFILARVFREGTRMRADLEGTV